MSQIAVLEDGVLRLAQFDLLGISKLITAEIAEITVQMELPSTTEK